MSSNRLDYFNFLVGEECGNSLVQNGIGDTRRFDDIYRILNVFKDFTMLFPFTQYLFLNFCLFICLRNIEQIQ